MLQLYVSFCPRGPFHADRCRFPGGDLLFQAQRRAWMQATSRRGIKSFGYLITDKPPDVESPIEVPEMDSGRLGGAHTCRSFSSDLRLILCSLPRSRVVLCLWGASGNRCGPGLCHSWDADDGLLDLFCNEPGSKRWSRKQTCDPYTDSSSNRIDWLCRSSLGGIHPRKSDVDSISCS